MLQRRSCLANLFFFVQEHEHVGIGHIDNPEYQQPTTLSILAFHIPFWPDKNRGIYSLIYSIAPTEVSKVY